MYTIKERQYFDHIEKAYDFASKLLLDLLMEEKELMARLRLQSLKTFNLHLFYCTSVFNVYVKHEAQINYISMK